MKHTGYITLVFVLFFHYCSTAQQSSQLATLKIQKLSYGLLGTMQNIYPGPQGSTYVLTSHSRSFSTAWSKQNLIVTKFDSLFEFVEKIEFKDVRFDPNSSNGGLAFCNDSNMNLYVIWPERTKKSVTLYSKMIEDSGIRNKLLELATEKKQRVREMTVESSSNGLYSVIYFSFSQKKKGGETHIIVLNENAKLFQSYTRKIDREIVNEEIAVSNDGRVSHLFVTVESTPKRDLNLYSLDLALLGHGAKIGSFSKPDNPVETISSSLTFGKEKLFFNTFFRTSKKKRAKSKKGKKGKIKMRPYYTLHQTIFDINDLSLISSSENGVSQSKTEKAIEGGAENIVIRNSLIMKDESVLVLTEAVIDNPAKSVSRVNAHTGQFETHYKMPSGLYLDILAIHISPNGEILKSKVIDKKQLGIYFWLFSFKPVKIGDDYYIVYFDQKKNTKMIKFSLDENSELKTNSQNFHKNEMAKRAVVQRTISCGRNNDIYAVLNHPRKKAKVVKFILNQD